MPRAPSATGLRRRRRQDQNVKSHAGDGPHVGCHRGLARVARDLGARVLGVELRADELGNTFRRRDSCVVEVGEDDLSRPKQVGAPRGEIAVDDSLAMHGSDGCDELSDNVLRLARRNLLTRGATQSRSRRPLRHDNEVVLDFLHGVKYRDGTLGGRESFQGRQVLSRA